MLMIAVIGSHKVHSLNTEGTSSVKKTDTMGSLDYKQAQMYNICLQKMTDFCFKIKKLLHIA